MGAAGASLGTLVAEFVVLTVQILYLKDLFLELLNKYNMEKSYLL